MTIKDYKAATEELRSTVIELRWSYMAARVDAGIANWNERFRAMLERKYQEGISTTVEQVTRRT